jgi:hypothetical protein
MPQGVTCHQPISLIDVYPTLIDVCSLPQNPNAGRSDYSLDGHSLKPLVLDPDGDWSGPKVAITALPGKDHSQHVQHTGTLYPHFSVRSRDWRYSLTSDGQEELYHYSNDPYEFTNLAGQAEFANIKKDLRARLIALRDGGAWEEYESMPTEKLRGFELLAEIKGSAEFKLGETVVAQVDSNDWVPVRIRVAGRRSQVWLDNRVSSDVQRPNEFAPGVLTCSGDPLRNIRIREVLPQRN